MVVFVVSCEISLRTAIVIDVFAADGHVSVEFAPEFRLGMDEGVRGRVVNDRVS
jgi:hypothetical protein